MRFDPVVERRSSLMPALVLGCLAVAGVVSLSTMLSAHPNVDTTLTAKLAPPSRWTDRPLSEAAFVLEVAEFTKAPPEYLAETQTANGNLRDTIILGDDKRFIRLTMQREGAAQKAALERAALEKATLEKTALAKTGSADQGAGPILPIAAKPADFYVEMVRRSADAGLAIARAGQPQMVASRFGKLEVADLSLTGPQGSLTCAGLRIAEHAPQFTISGLMCGMSLPLNVEKIACLTDRLELKDSDDLDLIDIFTNADQVSVCKTPRIRQVKVPVAELAPAPVAPKPAKKKHGAKKKIDNAML